MYIHKFNNSFIITGATRKEKLYEFEGQPFLMIYDLQHHKLPIQNF